MALNRKTFPKVTAAADTFTPSEHFNTVLYTGTGAAQRIGGYINRGAKFNGSNSSITQSEHLINADAFSLSFWFRTSTNAASTSDEYIFSFRDASRTFHIRTHTDGKIAFNNWYGYTVGTHDLRSTSTYTDGDWHHCVLTYDNSLTNKVVGYIDGAADSNLTSDSSYTNFAAQTLGNVIGNFDGGTRAFTGELDQVRYFNKALSSSEVTTLYNETHASTTKSTTDIFGDGSGVALYQLDGNANDTGGVSGKYGSAAIFNGSSSVIDFSQPLLINTFSVSFWINTSQQLNRILGNPYGGAGDYGWNIRTESGTGHLEVEWSADGTNAIILDTGQSVTDGDWHHIVAVWSEGSQKIYIDNVEEASSTNASDQYATTDTFKIGANWNNTDYFKGRLDDIRIYSDVLTSTEVGYIYNNTTASIPTDNLTAHYTFEGHSRDVSSAPQYDGTASNVTYGYNGTASNIVYQEATSFSPDLVWIKDRDRVVDSAIIDSVRGVGQVIRSNQTTADTYRSDSLTSFDSTGFTLGADGVWWVNKSADDYVAWCWSAGTDAAASNTDGSITSTVKANTEAGFSIVSYTGDNGSSATIGHGLNSAPELVIIKARNLAAGWPTLAAPNGTIAYTRRLNDTGATDSGLGSVFFNSTAPTSSVFTVGNSDEVNDGYNYIAYCFHSVDGYQKIGSYTGTGASGNAVDVGFEPAFVMVKRTDSTSGWLIVDNKRGSGHELYPHANTAELSSAEGGTYDRLHLEANGFTFTGSAFNESGSTWIYLAIAADPDETTPTVENSFDVVTYSGNSSTQTIETDFKPDLVWVKRRSAAADNVLFDSIRGAGKEIYSNLTNAEATATSLTAFEDGGFSLGNNNGVNQSGHTYVGWCWKAGDHDDSLPEINTDGATDATVSVNAAAGFSIVKYYPTTTDTTVGHGLGVQPKLYIAKNLDSSEYWLVGSTLIPNNKGLKLNETGAQFTTSGWSSEYPTSEVVSVNINNNANYILYCWADVTGYQKIGSYTGTGAAGNAQTTGFKPRFLLAKATSTTGNWFILDSQRQGSDSVDLYLFPDSNVAEGGSANTNVNFTSTGFSFDGPSYNDNNVTFIYLAIA